MQVKWNFQGGRKKMKRELGKAFNIIKSTKKKET